MHTFLHTCVDTPFTYTSFVVFAPTPRGSPCCGIPVMGGALLCFLETGKHEAGSLFQRGAGPKHLAGACESLGFYSHKIEARVQ